MQNCREISRLIDSDGLEHVGWPTRLLTRVHLLYCKHCRQYAMEVATMGRIGREALSADSVSPEAVQRLERSIMDSALDEYDEGPEGTSDDEGERPHS